MVTQHYRHQLRGNGTGVFFQQPAHPEQAGMIVFQQSMARNILVLLQPGMQVIVGITEPGFAVFGESYLITIGIGLNYSGLLMGGTSNQDGPTRGGWASAYYFDSLGNIPCAGGNLVGNGDNASPAGIDGFAEIL